MDNKTFIKQLSQKIADYNTPEQAISQANSCDSLSNDIYTDSKRFIYELLQNADDASNQNRKT
jgi:HSP90 family molecular chaperone